MKRVKFKFNTEMLDRMRMNKTISDFNQGEYTPIQEPCPCTLIVKVMKENIKTLHMAGIKIN